MNKSSKKVQYCKICNDNPAKKDTFFDESVFKLTGTFSCIFVLVTV